MRVHESWFRDILRLTVWFPFRWVLSLLPLDAALKAIRLMGALHFRFARVKRRKLADRIRQATDLSGIQTASATRKYFENHYVDRLHIMLYPRLNSKEKTRQLIRFENIELLHEIMGHRTGVLIVQPHFGPVQLTLLQLALEGYRPLQIGLPTDNGLSRIGTAVSFRYRLKYEQMIPAPIMAADRFLGKAYRHLLAGGIVLTTGDGAGGGIYLGEHRHFDFLGKDRPVPLGPASLAIKTRAVYLPTFIVPECYNRFRIVFETPIFPECDDPETAKADMTGRFLRVAERYVRTYPHCWHFWDEI